MWFARDRGWPNNWLNNKAVMFIPTWGQVVEWQPIFDDTNVSIAVAPLDALPSRTIELLERIMVMGLPEKPKTPPRPDFT